MPDADLERIRAFLNRPGATKLFLGHVADVSKGTLANLDQPGFNPSVRIRRKLLSAVERLEAAIGN